jgi:TetR/AcrR family transcriptional regulator, copper-responsive repressor
MDTEKRQGRPARFDRELVLDRATELFAQHGYSGTSLSELVRAIGCTPPSLYNYFPSKGELYLAVIDRYWARVNPEVPTQGRAWTLLEGYLMSSLVGFTRDPGPRGCLVLTGGFRESVEDQGLKEAVQKIRQEALDKFTNLVVRAKDEGDLPSELDASALARGLFALLQGLALQSIDGATLDELNGGLHSFLSRIRR